MSTRQNRQRLWATTVHVQVDLLYRLALRAAEAVLSSNSASMMFTCGGSDTPPRVFGSGWPGNRTDVSRIQPGIKYFNTRKHEFRHVHLRPRRTVSAITCATTPTASYHEISINWNCTEHLHSSEPLKLNPGQFQKHEPPRGAPSVRRFCRCQSLYRHTASIKPKERHRSRQLRVFVTAVSTVSTRNSTLALDRSGSVLIRNTLPGHSVPVQRHVYLLAAAEQRRGEPSAPGGTWLFLFAAGFAAHTAWTRMSQDRAHPPRAQRLRTLTTQHFSRTLEF